MAENKTQGAQVENQPQQSNDFELVDIRNRLGDKELEIVMLIKQNGQLIEENKKLKEILSERKLAPVKS